MVKFNINTDHTSHRKCVFHARIFLQLLACQPSTLNCEGKDGRGPVFPPSAKKLGEPCGSCLHPFSRGHGPSKLNATGEPPESSPVRRRSQRQEVIAYTARERRGGDGYPKLIHAERRRPPKFIHSQRDADHKLTDPKLIHPQRDADRKLIHPEKKTLSSHTHRETQIPSSQTHRDTDPKHHGAATALLSNSVPAPHRGWMDKRHVQLC